MAFRAAKSVRSLPSPGEFRVSILENDILSLAFSGRMDGVVADRAVVEVRRVLGGRRARVILCDTLGITDVEISSRQGGRELLDVARTHGVVASYCAASSTAVRMIGVALGLAVGVRVHFFSTIADARAAATGLPSLRR